MEVECRADGLVSMCFAICPFHLFKILLLPRKSEARSCEVLHLSLKIILANLKIWCSKLQPLFRPDLLTSLMNMSLVLRLPREMYLCRSSSNALCLPSFLDMLQNLHVLLTFGQVQNPLCVPRKTTSQLQKVLGDRHFFFLPFAFQMCFAPQRRALFRHGNFQKWSDTEVFCEFWLRNVLRATTACTFSTSQLPTSQLPKVLRAWCALYILTSKCASRHNGVQFFISHLATWLRTCRFSEPTFRPSGATNHWKKHCVSRLSYLSAHLDLLSSETFLFWSYFFFSSLLFSSLLFASLLFADSSHLFSSRLFFSLLFSSFLFFSLLFSSFLFFSLLFSSLHFTSLLFSSLLWLFLPLPVHLPMLSEVWLLNLLRLWHLQILEVSDLSLYCLMVAAPKHPENFRNSPSQHVCEDVESFGTDVKIPSTFSLVCFWPWQYPIYIQDHPG